VNPAVNGWSSNPSGKPSEDGKDNEPNFNDKPVPGEMRVLPDATLIMQAES